MVSYWICTSLKTRPVSVPKFVREANKFKIDPPPTIEMLRWKFLNSQYSQKISQSVKWLLDFMWGKMISNPFTIFKFCCGTPGVELGSWYWRRAYWVAYETNGYFGIFWVLIFLELERYLWIWCMWRLQLNTLWLIVTSRFDWIESCFFFDKLILKCQSKKLKWVLFLTDDKYYIVCTSANVLYQMLFLVGMHLRQGGLWAQSWETRGFHIINPCVPSVLQLRFSNLS